MHGITFESDMARVRATDNGRDTQKRFSAKTHQFKAKLKKIPLLRVFPAFGKAGTVFFIVLIALLLTETFFPEALAFSIPDTLVYLLLVGGAFLILIVTILARKRIKRLLQYHGAEHMAINTYRQRKALTIENITSADQGHTQLRLVVRAGLSGLCRAADVCAVQRLSSVHCARRCI